MPFSGPFRASPSRSEFRHIGLAVSVSTGFLPSLRSASSLEPLRTVVPLRCSGDTDQYPHLKTPGQAAISGYTGCPPKFLFMHRKQPVIPHVPVVFHRFRTASSTDRAVTERRDLPIAVTDDPSKGRLPTRNVRHGDVVPTTHVDGDALQASGAVFGQGVIDELSERGLHRCTDL